MREIKFKGRAIDTKEWLYGYVAPCEYNELCIVNYVESGNDKDVLHINRVDPDTICQYTGLKDSNGNEIYEGDVLACNRKEQQIKALVEFGNPNEGFDWGWQLIEITKTIFAVDILLWVECELVYCKVIGNKFDNPELLEQGTTQNG